MGDESGGAWLRGFRDGYEKIFVKEWSPFVGAVLLVLVIVSLMVSGLLWGVFGGVKFWGDWINNLIGLGPALGIPGELEGFLSHRMSLMNILLVPGGVHRRLAVATVFPQSAAPAGICLGRARWRHDGHRRGVGRRLHHRRLL